jgi:hypothetical protein
LFYTCPDASTSSERSRGADRLRDPRRWNGRGRAKRGGIAAGGPARAGLTHATWDYASTDGVIHIGTSNEMGSHAKCLKEWDNWNPVNDIRTLAKT